MAWQSERPGQFIIIRRVIRDIYKLAKKVGHLLAAAHVTPLGDFAPPEDALELGAHLTTGHEREKTNNRESIAALPASLFKEEGISNKRAI